MTKKYSLSRGERLKSVVKTQKLFLKGKSFKIFPFHVYYRLSNNAEIIKNQFVISVGKHFFKHAVDRNRMKRLVREAYRKNKQLVYLLSEEKNVFFNVGFVYKSSSKLDYVEIEKIVIQALNMLKEKMLEL
ncbi:MAG: ribonuclease P protein component [Bacteroidales bacterium]|nr:ribonuclease P protein component [Bacteroidales bacterium]